MLSVGALALMSLHWWHPGTVVAQGDVSPILHPGVFIARSLAAWSRTSSYFGQIDASFSFIPFMALTWVLTRIFGAGLAQVLLYFGILAAAWTGAFCCARRCGFSLWASTAGAWLYTLNPLTQLMVGFFASTQSWFVALIAWIAYFAIDVARTPERGTRARAALASIGLFAFAVLGVTPTLVFQVAVGSAVIALFCSSFARDARGFWRWSAGTAGVLVAVCAWWAIPDVLAFVGAVIPHPTSLAGNAWTYARSSFLNNERFLWEWSWMYPEYYPAAAAYDGNVFVYAAGFVPFAAGLLGLALLRGRLLAAARVAMAWTLISIVLSKGVHPPLVWLDAALWKLPGMFLFDDPVGVAALSLLLLCIVAAAVFDALFARRPVRTQGAVAAAAAIVAALSAILLVTGAIQHGPVNAPDGFDMPSMYVRVPSYWDEAAAYLNDTPQPGGVLVLPPTLSNGYDVFYRWGYYGVGALPQNEFLRPVLQLDRGLLAGLGYIKHRRSQEQADSIHALLDAQSPAVVAALRRIGVRYVLYRNDFYDAHHVWLTDAQVARMLGRRPLRFGALSLYDLGRPAPRVFVARSWGDAVDTARLERTRRTIVSRPLRSLPATGLPLGVDASADPALVIDAAQAVQVTALYVAFGARAYDCPLYVPLQTSTRLDDSIVPCLRAHGIEPTPPLLARVRIERIVFAPNTTAQPGTVALAVASSRLAVSRAAGFSADGTGAAGACRARGTYCGSGLVTFRVQRPGLAVLSELASPSWIALLFGRGVSLPRHVLVNGWANGWMVTQGRLVLVNVVVAFQVLALALAIGVVTWLVLRASRLSQPERFRS